MLIDEIPLVLHQHDGSAAVDDLPGQLLLLLADRLGRVQQQQGDGGAVQRLAGADRRERIAKERDRLLQFLDFAPMRRISAQSGRGVGKLFGDIDQVLAAWQRRVPTGKLNQWLADAVAATPPPLGQSHRPVRIRYATQVGTEPPRFKLFTNQRLEPAYLRYLERRLRERFDFAGTPIRLEVSLRTAWEDREPS